MRSATALAAVPMFTVDEECVDQIPLPLPQRPVTLLPVPFERGPQPEQPLREGASRFLQALVETLAGERSARQLSGWLAPDVYRVLERRIAIGSRRPAHRQPQGRGRARIASVHVSMISPTIAEIAGRMVHRGRSRALAIRLELRDLPRDRRRWVCTALEWA
ncbi:MAG: Rv3235 family protein [Aeromicrobium sp.]|uniref:Rv3235 family protein n=1 Tax=Aeromicrobium sp. TaxID=1871063 RepID=UPI0039E61C1A